jgi:hypothetical protein
MQSYGVAEFLGESPFFSIEIKEARKVMAQIARTMNNISSRTD